MACNDKETSVQKRHTANAMLLVAPYLLPSLRRLTKTKIRNDSNAFYNKYQENHGQETLIVNPLYEMLNVEPLLWDDLKESYSTLIYLAKLAINIVRTAHAFL